MKLAKRALTYALIVALALVCATNYQLFVFPNRFAPAGLNGICTMIQYLSGISVGYLSLVVNIPLALLARRRVGRTLAGRSMLYLLCFSVFLIALGRLDLSRFSYETANGTSKILGPLVAGIINGGCFSLLMRCGACSGGMDFVAAVIHRRRPEKNFFYLSFLLNALVAVASYFVYDFQVEPVILCILYSFLSSTVSDQVLKSGRSAVQFEIVTDDPEEISRQIIGRLHHSATLIPGRGMYLGRETNILLCVVNKSQVAALEEIIREHPRTFAVLSGVSEVVGNFKRMDTHGKPEKELLDVGDGKSI